MESGISPIARDVLLEFTEFNMAMQMQQAFDRRMLTKLTRYSVAESTYDENNHIVKGKRITSRIFGVIKAGNKFSQFEEGEALHSEDGGQRYSDYKTLYVTDKNTLDLQDKLGVGDKYYNILQRSDEAVYGFYSYLLEKSEGWTP